LEAGSLKVEDCDLIIPNVITPNGDGMNDVLGIKKLNPKRPNELTIYDRWGKTVFHQKNYKCVFKGNEYLNKEEAFEGLSQSGQKLPEGTYYYAFKYDAIPKVKKYTGTIVILR
jgi:gliding motility-associated-like protein